MTWFFKTIADVKRFFNLIYTPWLPTVDYQNTGNIQNKTSCGETIIRYAYGQLYSVTTIELNKRKQELLNKIEILEEQIHRCYDYGGCDDLCPQEHDLAKLHNMVDEIEYKEKQLSNYYAADTRCSV
jgi:hypothetical protein